MDELNSAHQERFKLFSREIDQMRVEVTESEENLRNTVSENRRLVETLENLKENFN